MFKARGVKFYCKVVRLHLCALVTLLVHITSDVERLGSAVDSFGAKWDSLKPLPSQKVPWFSVDNKCCTLTWRSRSGGSGRISTVQFTAQTVQLQPRLFLLSLAT